MTVDVNSERKGIEVSWDTTGGASEPDAPDGFPTHPIYLPGEPTHPIVLPPPVGGEPSHPIFLPPYVDIGFPADQPYPDQSLPGDQPIVDAGFPEDQPEVDAGFPADQPIVTHPIVIPPGSYTPPEGAFPGDPGYNPPSPEPPVSTPQHDETTAVQVFGQGQDGDWSNSAIQPNDGLAFLSYPKGFTGSSYIEVRALDGSLVDAGTITVE